MNQTLKIGQVFVPGGQPIYTYNPRKASSLEERLQDYLDSPFKILSLTGATKSGKTVLARKNLPKNEAIWVSGGQINTSVDLWNKIIDASNLFTEVSKTEAQSSTQSDSRKLDATAKVAGFGGGVATDHTERNNVLSQQSYSRKTDAIFLATNFLSNTRAPLVIDDFHYISSEVQLKIIRALKECVFEGVPVIIIAVPHRAYDAVRVEKEMTGRVQQLPIPPWQPEDLSQIAGLGFNALNLDTSKSITDRLVMESFKSPHIVQEFCLSICRSNKIREAACLDNKKSLTPPADWDRFFRDKANQMGRKEFERGARHPLVREKIS
ncbi:MAG: ATP-binding protein [Cyanobacteria bacterium P01_D01_bin.14]